MKINPQDQSFYLLFLTATAVYIIGMLKIDIINIDASLYAEMSRELLDSGNPLQFKNRIIENYLDKPPLLFWLSSASYYLFGVSHFAYRLPTFLATLLGVYSTYRFAKIYYKRQTALIAALMLYTCQAWFLINHDVRTDTLLANFVIFGSWQLAAYLNEKKIYQLVLAFSGFGLAMLAKGPIGIMVPAIGFGSHFILKKQWKNIFRWEWLVGLIIIAIVLSPMVYGLYKQYGSFGPEFFFWTQSFGRITGDNHWQSDTDPFFFMHTFLWSFIPWMVLSVFAIFFIIKNLIVIKGEFQAKTEFISIGAFIITFIMMSQSSYKLPHYIYVVFPFAAVFTADFTQKLISGEYSAKLASGIKVTQGIILLLLWIAVLALLFWAFPVSNLYSWIIFSLFAGFALVFFIVLKDHLSAIVFASVFTIIGINYILNSHFYPELLKYQASRQIAFEIKEKNIDPGNLYYMNTFSSALDFYAGCTPAEINERKLERLTANSGVWLVTNQAGYDSIKSSGYELQSETAFDYFQVQLLSLKFLNPKTRESTLQKWYLVEVE